MASRIPVKVTKGLNKPTKSKTKVKTELNQEKKEAKKEQERSLERRPRPEPEWQRLVETRPEWPERDAIVAIEEEWSLIRNSAAVIDSEFIRVLPPEPEPEPEPEWPPKFRAPQFKVDYYEALKNGKVKVAYARVMLVGPGGVGKSSLLNGLMNLPLPSEAHSTQLADALTLRPTDNFWARSQCGSYWTKVTNKDEINELIQSVRALAFNRRLASTSTKNNSDNLQEGEGKPVNEANITRSRKFSNALLKIQAHSLEGTTSTSECISKILDDIFKEASEGDLLSTDEDSISDIETFFRVWDCGGQPVFLNLLPAFLTARTLFLLMFDARYGLLNQCLHLSHLKGVVTESKEEITTLELMVQWMALIHATLLRKRSFSNDYDLKRFPRILPVGTHGDDENVKSKKKDIFRPLTEVCADKAFTHLLLDGVIVDNTTAGTRENEDPHFNEIREAARKFAAEDLSVITPLTWVLFRKVFHRYAKGKPIVPLEEVMELAIACSIPEKAVDSVLAFYHDLSVFFHYTDVPSLKPVVIADPRWLIKQMAKIFALEGCEVVKNDNLWKLLRENGILVESLYTRVLRTQKILQPQDIIDLLEHFLIIARIYTNSHRRSGREYFVPCMLPRSPSDRPPHSTMSRVQSAAPLHLLFSTNYLPPGFFTRLAAVMSKHPKCEVDQICKLYRNEIKFLFGSPEQQVDELTIVEQKRSVCIQMQRISSREYSCPTFMTSCNQVFQILRESFVEVKKWLPGIDVSFALACDNCPQKDHFIPLPSTPSSRVLLCQRKVQTKLTPQHKLWYNIQQDHAARTNIPEHEIVGVAREVEKCGKVEELAETLEMSEHLEGVKGDASILIDRWQKEMTLIDTNTPSRLHLMHHLTVIGMQDVQRKLQFNEFKSGDEELQSTRGLSEISQLKRELEQLKSSNTLEKEQFKQELEKISREKEQIARENELLKRDLEHFRIATGGIAAASHITSPEHHYGTVPHVSISPVASSSHGTIPRHHYSTGYSAPITGTQEKQRVPDFQTYVSSLPASARPCLELLLDFGHEGAEKDLYEIARHMLNWEEMSALLGLTATDISDMKDMHPNKPALQRQEALRKWKKKLGPGATYGNLLEVFVQAGHTACAEALCRVLKMKY